MADIRTVDLNLLKAFDALMEERSVTRAAARLALTQPAVSGMLTRLRDSFNDPLFVRTPRGITPTPRAEELAGPVRRVLNDIDGMLRAPLFDPATASMTLTLAATDYAMRAIVVPFLAALRRQAPHIRVAVLPIDDERLAGQLERGDIDLALITPDAAGPDLHARRLFDEQYVCAMRRDHAHAAAGGLSLDQFCALDHAIVSFKGANFKGVTDAALAKLGRERRVTLSVPSFLVLPDVLHASDLIAVVPRRLVAGLDGIVLLPPPLPIPGFTKVAAWHARSHDDAAHGWARALLFATCAD